MQKRGQTDCGGGGYMYVGATLFREQISGDMRSFIGEHICSFTKLDIIRFFGLNPASRLDSETLLEISGDNRAEIDDSLAQLVKSHLLDPVKVDSKTFYEMTNDKGEQDKIKKFIALYSKPSARLLIIGHVMNQRVEKT